MQISNGVANDAWDSKKYANDPVGLMNHNASFSSPALQKQWIEMQTGAAKSLAGIAATEQVKQQWVAARQLMLAPGAPEIRLDDQGIPSSDWIGGIACQATG